MQPPDRESAAGGCAAPRVLMLLDNEYSPDPRVEREIGELLRIGWRVRLVCWDRQALRPEVENPSDRLEIHRIRTPAPRQLGARQMVNLLGFHQRVLAMRERLLDDATRVIHCHDLLMLPLGCLLSAASSRRRALIYDAHEIYALMDAHRYPRPLLRAVEDLERRLIDHRVDAFVTVSEQRVREYWRPRLRHRPMHVVGNWFQSKEVSLARRAKTRRRLRIDEDAFVVGYLGSLHQNRRVDLLVQAVKEMSGAVAVVGGRGTREERIAEIARSSDRVRYLGWVEDPWPVYEAFDAVYYVMDTGHPYARFNAPNNVHMAAALGLPVIVGPGGEAETMAREHMPGVVLSELSVEAVKEAVSRAARAVRSGEWGMTPRSPFTAERAAEALHAAYREAISSADRRDGAPPRLGGRIAAPLHALVSFLSDTPPTQGAGRKSTREKNVQDD